MIFSVQRFLEDHFERRGLRDTDQLAIRVANAFNPNQKQIEFISRIHRIKTIFFRTNGIDRREFEESLADMLYRQFPKKKKKRKIKASTAKRIGKRTRKRNGHKRAVRHMTYATAARRQNEVPADVRANFRKAAEEGAPDSPKEQHRIFLRMVQGYLEG